MSCNNFFREDLTRTKLTDSLKVHSIPTGGLQVVNLIAVRDCETKEYDIPWG